MIRSVAVATTVSALIISIACFFVFGSAVAFSSSVGGALMVFNLLGLWLLWKIIFSKKSIALVVLVIIFKYSILGLILWSLGQIQWIRPIGLCLGLSSLIFGILSSIYFRKIN